MLTDEHLAIFHRVLFWALLVPSKKKKKKNREKKKGVNILHSSSCSPKVRSIVRGIILIVYYSIPAKDKRMDLGTLSYLRATKRILNVL